MCREGGRGVQGPLVVWCQWMSRILSLVALEVFMEGSTGIHVPCTQGTDIFMLWLSRRLLIRALSYTLVKTASGASSLPPSLPSLSPLSSFSPSLPPIQPMSLVCSSQMKTPRRGDGWSKAAPWSTITSSQG